MKIRILAFILVFFPFAVFASSHVVSFEFVTDAQTIQSNEISEKITVQFQNSAGEPVSVGQTSCLNLISSSVSGEFSSSDTNWNPVDVLTINSNWASRGFYYRASSEGAHTITASVAVKPEEESRSCPNWPIEEWNIAWTAEQQITIGSSGFGQESQQENQNESADAGVSQIYPKTSVPKAEFGAKVLGGDRVAIIGSQVNFEGALLDSSGEPRETADFLWSFGDGARMRGRLASHTYNYPGEYIVFLNVGVSGASFSDSIIVDVIPNEVVISEVKPGAGGWVEILNGSEYKIDLSYWAVSNGREAFYFPKNTFISARAHLVITKEISGIEFLSSGTAFLLYPRGEVAHELSHSGALRADESFHNIEGIAKAGIESPASNRFVARVSLTASKSPVAYDASDESAREIIDVQSQVSKEVVPLHETKQTAAAATSKFFGSTMFWFLTALAVGILSAVGYLFINRKSPF